MVMRLVLLLLVNVVHGEIGGRVGGTVVVG